MTEPNPLQLRTAQLRESHLQRQIGNLVLALAQCMAERDTYAQEVEQLRAELAERDATIAKGQSQT